MDLKFLKKLILEKSSLHPTHISLLDYDDLGITVCNGNIISNISFSHSSLSENLPIKINGVATGIAKINQFIFALEGNGTLHKYNLKTGELSRHNTQHSQQQSSLRSYKNKIYINTASKVHIFDPMIQNNVIEQSPSLPTIKNFDISASQDKVFILSETNSVQSLFSINTDLNSKSLNKHDLPDTPIEKIVVESSRHLLLISPSNVHRYNIRNCKLTSLPLVGCISDIIPYDNNIFISSLDKNTLTLTPFNTKFEPVPNKSDISLLDLLLYRASILKDKSPSKSVNDISISL